MRSCLLPLVLSLVACGSEGVATVELPSCGAWRAGHWDQRLVPSGVMGAGAYVTGLARTADGVVAVGWFTGVSGAASRNVAAWDGTEWSPLGAGVQDPVRSVAVDDAGDVWVVTEDTDKLDGAGGRKVLRWTGAAWSLELQQFDQINGIAAIAGGVAVYGQFFDGKFSSVGVRVLRDGTWRDIAPFSGAFVTTLVRAGDSFCATGTFPGHRGVACYDDDQDAWVPLGNSLVDLPTVLARSPEGRWFAGSPITTLLAGGVGQRFALLTLDNGTWTEFEGGVAPPETGTSYVPTVQSILFGDDGELVIAGHFSYVGEPRVEAYDLARWSPRTGWAPVTSVPGDLFHGVATAVLAGDRVIVGGSFTSIGSVAGAGVASVSPAEVRALPPSDLAPTAIGRVQDLVATRDGIVLAGAFTENGAPLASLVQFADAWTPLAGDVLRERTVSVAAALPDGSVAVQVPTLAKDGGDGASELFRRYPDGREVKMIAQNVDPPMFVDGDGALFVTVPRTTDANTTIVRIGPDDTGVFATAPGRVVGLTGYGGDLIAVVAGADATEIALRWTGDGWESIGAWTGPTTSIVATPALGLVVATGLGTRVWDGATWRVVSRTQTRELAACADGVVGAITDETGATSMAFLADPDAGWEVLSAIAPSTDVQFAVSEHGIYSAMSTTFEPGPTQFGRWSSLPDEGW